MTTASALCAQAAVRFKDPNNRVISANEWLNYLNQCYKQVNSATPLWPWLESSEQLITVLSGARSAALPTDVVGINWVYNTTSDYRMVPQEGRGDQWHQDHLRSEVGQPVTYRLRSGNLEVFPAPDSMNVIFAVECTMYPAALNAAVEVATSVAGGAAGNLTVAGIAVGDVLQSVVGVKTSDQSVHDFTSEFSIFAANTITNTGGTSSTGYVLIVTYSAPSSSDSPIYPTVYHEDLIEGMLALAYLDDGTTAQYQAYWVMFQARIKQMLGDVLLSRTETNVPIRDTFWS